LDHGADANISNSFGQTPLHTAARRKLNEMSTVSIGWLFCEADLLHGEFSARAGISAPLLTD
jgi:hypothetical protein